MSIVKRADRVLLELRSDVQNAIRTLENIDSDLETINVPELEVGLKAWKECLEAGLPTIVAKYGESSTEAAVIRDLLK